MSERSKKILSLVVKDPNCNQQRNVTTELPQKWDVDASVDAAFDEYGSLYTPESCMKNDNDEVTIANNPRGLSLQHESLPVNDLNLSQVFQCPTYRKLTNIPLEEISTETEKNSQEKELSQSTHDISMNTSFIAAVMDVCDDYIIGENGTLQPLMLTSINTDLEVALNNGEDDTNPDSNNLEIESLYYDSQNNEGKTTHHVAELLPEGTLFPTIVRQVFNKSEHEASNSSSEQDLDSENEGQPHETALDETRQESDGSPVIEPRKQRSRSVSIKTNPGRKRTRNPETWKRNVQKQKRNKGEQYENNKGVFVEKKSMKKACSLNCKKKCSSKVSETQRQSIFKRFWGVGDYNKQNAFIAQYVKRVPKKRQIVKDDVKDSRKSSNLLYSLPILSHETVIVCKTMFLNTLGVSDMRITTSMKKKDAAVGGIVTPDKRGSSGNSFRVAETTKNSIRTHIGLFPAVEAHYCRERTKKKYLQGELSISKMYRMYLEWAQENNIRKVATERQYREVFTKEFNIDFYVPKKDQCDVCNSYNLIENKTEEDHKRQSDHLANKEKVRSLKQEDKSIAIENPDISVACFDLLKVILLPASETSSFYYKCKLSVYNFTIFDLATKQGFCYIWHEQIAKRGSIEIASCLLDFISTCKRKKKTTISLYSDNCVGQNKNRFVTSMYLYAVKTLGITIIHRFLEQGHTQNENDSMHALIERNKKGKDIFVPEQFVMLVKMAKVNGKPYVVKEMSQEDFFDFKSFHNITYKPFTKDTNNEKINWNAVKEIKICAEEPKKILIRYDLQDESYKEIQVVEINRRSTKRKKTEMTPEDCNQGLSCAYNKPLPISKKKFEHLQFLSMKIPTIYRNFYENLVCDDAVIDETED